MSEIPGLKFNETMWGYVAEAIEDFRKGYKTGEKTHNRIQFWVTIDIENMEDFLNISKHRANLTGKITCSSLGNDLEIKNGEFYLFRPSETTGKRLMIYKFDFFDNDGKKYNFFGQKEIYDDPSKFDLLEDMTTLFTKISLVTDMGLKHYGAGILNYNLTDLPSMMTSMKVTNSKNLLKIIKTKMKFYKFIYSEVRDTYFHDLSMFYFTEYENLVLSGKISHNGDTYDFFFFSGVHDKDFPWGDKFTFWDIALLIKKDNEKYKRYVLTNHSIENLILDVANGSFHYEGEIYEITEGRKAFFTQMRKENLPETLKKLRIRIDLKFKANPFITQHVPFKLIPNYKRHINKSLIEKIHNWRNHIDNLGLHLTPHKVEIDEGEIEIENGSDKKKFTIIKEDSFGEAEISSFQNIRWPTLYYNYFCTLNPELRAIGIHIRTDVLRVDRKEILSDKIKESMGDITNQVAWLDLKIKDDTINLLSRQEGDKFPHVKEVLLEINNDHYSTAVFQRRIVELRNSDTPYGLALEENMDILNLGSKNCDRTATVASVKDLDKFKALDHVLELIDFFNKLESLRVSKGKTKEDFSIIIKPNFMFMYSLEDPSTYTDPELVEYLISRIAKNGYKTINVAEARCTLSTFFTNREVSSVANYIGLDGVCSDGTRYKIIDLTLNNEEILFEGKLGKHSVNTEWKNADCRISFAKNKTHSYCFYTLTLKNIYGALPKENKFKEYHCERDIFSTTIEYIHRFPLDFGFIDAYISADGPFGIFADKNPNITETIIGGDDLVAVDWIGAAKMGLNPMVSKYMELAIEKFGKPEIQLLGDRTIYSNWVNVSDVISKFAFVLDREYYFGNFLYSILATMDSYFKYREESTLRRITRIFNKPIRNLFFKEVRTGKENTKLNKKLYKRFSKEKLEVEGSLNDKT